MFCKYCGKEIREDAAFCGECGNPVNKVVDEKQHVVDPVVNEDAVTGEAPAAEVQADKTSDQSYFAEPQSQEPVKKPKKKLAAIIACVTAGVLVVAVVMATCFDAIHGFCVKSFGSNDTYLTYVETKAFDVAVDEVSDGYGTILDNLNTDSAAKTTLKLNVGDRAISLFEDILGSYTDSSVDLQWLNTVSLDMDVNVKDNIEQAIAAINIDGKELVDMDVIMDMDNGEVFVALLSLSEKYLKSDISASEEYETMMGIFSDPNLKKALPSEKELDQLLSKYIEIVLDNIGEVEKYSDVLEVSDIEQKLTALEVEIDQQDVLNIASAVLEAANEDEQLKKYIEDVAKILEDADIIEDAGEVYDEFCYLVQDAIDSVENGVADSDSVIVLTDYVNNDHEVVGRKIEADGENILYYATVRDGKELAYEFVTEGIEISGEGTEKGNRLNAEYTIKQYSTKICDVVVTDFQTDSDYLNGNFRIKPSSELLDVMGFDSYTTSALAIVSPEIEFNFETKKDSGKIDINLLSGDEVFVGLTLSGKETNASNVKLPSSNDVYDADEADEWVETLDIEGMLDKAEDAGVPSDVIDLLEELFNSVGMTQTQTKRIVTNLY